jgi:hypothetical protein
MGNVSKERCKMAVVDISTGLVVKGSNPYVRVCLMEGAFGEFKLIM